MKNPILLILFVSFLSFVGCTNETEQDLAIVSNNEKAQSSTETNKFNPDEQRLLNRLQEINDSLRSIQGTVNTEVNNAEITRGSIDWGIVVSEDARGAKNGFSFGWKHGKGLLGKFKTAVLTSTIYAVAYSAWSVIKQTFSRPGLPEYNQYTLSDVTKAVAVSWNSNELTSRVQLVKNSYPELLVQNTDDELKMALVHNMALEKLESGVVIPAGTVNEVFSDEQIDFINSFRCKNYYNSVPDIIVGKKDFLSFVDVEPFPLVTEIAELYFDGINSLSQNNVATYGANMRTMANLYVSEIKSASVNVEADAESNLITIIYLAPMSLDHWSSIYK